MKYVKDALVSAAVVSALLLSGCGGSSAVKTVNDAATVARPSHTDKESRLLARRSLSLLT